VPTLTIPPGLPYRQAQFLSLLAVRPTLTRADYQFAAGVSRETARKDLDELLRARLILRLGDSRAIRYSRPFDQDSESRAAQSLPSSNPAPAEDLRTSGIIEHGLETHMLKAVERINRLAIVGDVAMEVADPTVVLAKAAPFLRESGIAFCNCEWPLTDRGAPWPGKAGRVVRSHPSKVETYAFAGFDAVGLANNHTMNYGPEGLLQTIELLDAAGIKHCGGGANLAEAHRPAVVEWQGTRVAFLSYTSVFTAGFEAMPGRPGLAVVKVDTTYNVPARLHEMPGSPLEVATTPDPRHKEQMQADVAAARQQADAVVVTWHWGVSMGYQHLVPYQTELGRAAIDAGADLVVGHHPHTLQAIEVYRGKPIAYSIAHFGFDMESSSFSEESVLLDVELKPGGFGQTLVRPVANSVQQPEIVDAATGRQTLEWLARLSKPVGTQLQITQEGAHCSSPTAVGEVR
jgi:poly-gamma-glutamate capsule biosynthesis protein CapA/YwtB (metallophosphatase superfamily)